MRTAPGDLLAGRYRIDRPVGFGGMATVYAGTDSRLGRPVAIKCLRPELSDPVARRRFEMESRMAARLNHPNIVAVHDAGEEDSCAFMVMELLPGRTVGDEMAAGRMSSARAGEVARQVLAALSVAHRAGVVHRDIKPSNLLLCPDGSVKVGDFGIATSAEAARDLTRTGELIGTVSYIAPERLSGAPATAASDVYSLGAVLYEALTGRRMYSADNPMAYARQVIDAEPVPVAVAAPGTDPALAAAIDRALTKDPLRRYADADEMLAALDEQPAPVDEILGWGLPAVAPAAVDPTDVLLRPATSESDRRWWGAAAVAAVAVVVILAVALAGHSSGNSPTPTTATTTPAAVSPVTASASVPAPLALDLAKLQAAVSNK